MRTFVLLILLTLTFSAVVRAEEPPAEEPPKVAEVRRALSEDQGRSWILRRLTRFLSGERRCKDGEGWTFFTDGRLVKRRCVAGKVIDEELHYSLRTDGALDVRLDVTGESLVVREIPKANAPKPQLVLRRRPVDRPTKTVDLTFTPGKLVQP